MSFVTVMVIVFLITRARKGQSEATPLSPTVRTVLMKWVALVFGSAGMATMDTPGAALTTIGLVVFCLPMPVLDGIVIPLGLSRTAYWIARLCRPIPFAGETATGALLCATLAAARRPSPKRLQWLRKKIDALPSPTGTGGVAAGVLAALAGDRNLARCLLRITDDPSSPPAAPLAKTTARDWLVADAARRADWQEVIRLGKRRQTRMRWSYAVAAMAERLIGQGQDIPDRTLWGLWLLAPRRRALYPFLRRALAAPRAAAPAPNNADYDAQAENLPAALADLARLLAQGHGFKAQTFAYAVRRVDLRLDHPATRHDIEQRLRALASPIGADRIVQRFRENLTGLIVPAIETAPDLALGAHCAASIMPAVDHVKRKLIHDITFRCADYATRAESQTFLAPYAEWNAWAELRHTADRLLTLDPGEENSLFGIVRTPLWDFAVKQYEREQFAMAHDMFAWLHRRARSEPEVANILKENAKVAKERL